jgi:hypothetical protein
MNITLYRAQLAFLPTHGLTHKKPTAPVLTRYALLNFRHFETIFFRVIPI